MSALLLQISSFPHWLQGAQVSWLGLCGPKPTPWSAGTGTGKSLPALIERLADDEQTLVHPFSLGGCQPGSAGMSKDE